VSRRALSTAATQKSDADGHGDSDVDNADDHLTLAIAQGTAGRSK
jgi:hypothetical protein